MDNFYKKIKNSRMLKNTGSWLYCNQCDKTVGYLCYTTYQSFYYSYECKCGNTGSFELGYKTNNDIKISKKILKLKKIGYVAQMMEHHYLQLLRKILQNIFMK